MAISFRLLEPFKAMEHPGTGADRRRPAPCRQFVKKKFTLDT
jgi:hypothetical protein